MIVEEFQVFFRITKPKSPPSMIDLYLCLSEQRFVNDPYSTREEIIVREGLFILSDLYPMHVGMTVEVIKIKLLHSHLKLGKGRQLVPR